MKVEQLVRYSLYYGIYPYYYCLLAYYSIPDPGHVMILKSDIVTNDKIDILIYNFISMLLIVFMIASTYKQIVELLKQAHTTQLAQQADGHSS